MAGRGFAGSVGRLGAAAALGLGLAACQPKDEPAARTEGPPAQTVAVTPVAETAVSRTVLATGTVMPWQELVVDAEAGGLAVVDVRVGENDAVAAGDILVRLDDRVLRTEVAQQKAAVAEAEAGLQSARRDAARGDALLMQKAMSLEDVETRRTAILTKAAKVDQARASLDQLQAQLDQTVIRAPAAGIVSTEPVRLGTVAQTGAELLRIIRDGRLEVQAKVPEQDLVGLRAAQAARITGPDGAVVDGTVRAVAAKLDATTRLGVAFIDLPPGTALRPGMFASVAVAGPSTTGLVVPEQALVWPGGKASVFVVGADGRAGLRAVAVAGRQSGLVTIRQGVAPGDRVVTAGAGFLHDGDTVAVRDALAADRMASR